MWVRVIKLSGGDLKRRDKWPKPIVDTSTPAPQKMDASTHVSGVTNQTRRQKSQPSILDNSRDTDDLASKRAYAIWRGSRVTDGKSEKPKEAEAHLSLRLG